MRVRTYLYAYEYMLCVHTCQYAYLHPLACFSNLKSSQIPTYLSDISMHVRSVFCCVCVCVCVCVSQLARTNTRFCTVVVCAHLGWKRCLVFAVVVLTCVEPPKYKLKTCRCVSCCLLPGYSRSKYADKFGQNAQTCTGSHEDMQNACLDAWCTLLCEQGDALPHCD